MRITMGATTGKHKESDSESDRERKKKHQLTGEDDEQIKKSSLSKTSLSDRRKTSDMAGENQVFKNEQDGQALVSAISRFALELYMEQGKRSKGNLFMSPFSISTVLSMAYLGARGKTLEEMKKVLCFDGLDVAKVHQAFSDFIAHLEACSKDQAFQLHMANRLYADESFKILEEFQNSCRNYYDAELVSVSFRKATDSAIAVINNWVEEKTNKKIKDIVSPDCVKASTVLILINAIYFKSAWRDQFKTHATQEADFTVSKGETIKVQLMFRKVEEADYCYSTDLKSQVLKLPYKFGALSMFVLLPDKASSTLEDLEKNLTAEHLISIDSGFQKRQDVNLWLPKFKMEEDLELKEVLSALGLTSIFESADFSGIDGTTGLCASQVVHKAFVDVNEDGTEAAAATAVIIGRCARVAQSREDPVEFRADHPFLFFIREEKSKAILFMGRVVFPKHS